MANRSLLSTEAKKPPKPVRITYLRVENFRALREVELKNVTPLTVLLGPNGSGKSTIFDVFAFLWSALTPVCGALWIDAVVRKN